MIIITRMWIGLFRVECDARHSFADATRHFVVDRVPRARNVARRTTLADQCHNAAWPNNVVQRRRQSNHNLIHRHSSNNRTLHPSDGVKFWQMKRIDNNKKICYSLPIDHESQQNCHHTDENRRHSQQHTLQYVRRPHASHSDDRTTDRCQARRNVAPASLECTKTTLL
jgi:hypothetical protein